VVEAEACLAVGGELLPVGAHRLQQVEGAGYVAFDESCWALDRAIHVALGRQVHHQVGVRLAHRFCSGGRLGQGLDTVRSLA
jgi:hypothetical protein